ncbi:MAG: phenylalanine--tRNA ligase subunit beta, partial [Gemmatimonadota bacterium]|nr:phenylalanine--tRNA ligase subunit beta [Gemmatimonadota bacterium]
LGLRDSRLVLDITPNRSDLLSHVGVARELAPGGVADIRLKPFSKEAPVIRYTSADAGPESGAFSVRIEDAAGCSRYLAAVVEGVTVAPSTEWLASRLRAIGARPVNNVVDATNWVLHELGQPLHAFDLDRLAGPEIRVRRARAGERIRTLDGVDRELSSSALVIADRDQPVALAGVMGGEESEVTTETSRILIECALFEPQLVRSMARGAGLSTDASYRYERGVDPEGMITALERVVDLVLAVAGGTITRPVTDAQAGESSRLTLMVRPGRVQAVLGVAIDAREMDELLTPIGFRVVAGQNGVAVVDVPTWRPDVVREIDVIEEIARRRGYDSFSADLGAFRPTAVPPDPIAERQHAAHRFFTGHGFLEARTAAFSPAGAARVELLNPLSAEESHLRDELVPGLIRRLRHNWAQGARAVRLYEIGTVFAPSGGPIAYEEMRVGAIFTGPSRPPHWSEPVPPFDLWDLKGLLAEAGETLTGSIRLVPDETGVNSLFDPAGSFAAVLEDGTRIGTGGRVKTEALDAPNWADPVWALELTLRGRERAAARPVADPPSFPPVDRDLALLVPEGVTAAGVEEVLRLQGGELLEGLAPFDVYHGEGLAPGVRSIAWRLRFRHPERTLTDGDVDRPIKRILERLEELGVHRR